MRVLAWKAPIRLEPARPIFARVSSGSNVVSGQRFRELFRQGEVDRQVRPTTSRTHGTSRVVADQPGAFGAGTGHDVEVVQVGVRGRDRRVVPAVRHEHDVVGAHLGEHRRSDARPRA